MVMRSLLTALPAGSCHVLCAHPDLYPPETCFDDALVPAGVPVTRVLPRTPVGPPGRRLPWDLAYAVDTVREARRLISHARDAGSPFTCVMGVYPDRWGLLAGLAVSLAERLPLVAYMHDYLAEALHGIHPLRAAWWRGIDHLALRRAALVPVPTSRFVDRYRRRGLARLMVLPHLVTPRVQSAAVRQGPGALEIVFTGMIYEAHQQAVEALVAAVRGMPDVRLRFATPPPTGKMASDFLEGVRVGPLSRAQCLAMQEAADVLFLPLGIDSPYPLEVQSCLPSKLLDYFASGRPVLAVVPPGCYAGELIEEAEAGIVVTTVAPGPIRAAVDRLRDPALRCRLGENALRAAGRFDPAHHAARLVRALEGLSRRSSEESGVRHRLPEGPEGCSAKSVSDTIFPLTPFSRAEVLDRRHGSTIGGAL